MNPDVSVPTRIGKRRMRFDGKQLMADSIAILRHFNPYACAAGIAATILFVSPLLDMHPLLSLALGVAVYAGVTLVWPQDREKDDLDEQLDPDEQAFMQARQATSRIMLLATQINKANVQQEVQEIGLAFDKMLNVMEEDKKYVAAPNYRVELISPFEDVLADYVNLKKRDIDLAIHQIATFEEIIIPQVRGFTKSFYQHYHDDRVRDWAARMEIFWDTVASQKEEDEDLDELPVEDEMGDGSNDLEHGQECDLDEEDQR